MVSLGRAGSVPSAGSPRRMSGRTTPPPDRYCCWCEDREGMYSVFEYSWSLYHFSICQVKPVFPHRSEVFLYGCRLWCWAEVDSLALRFAKLLSLKALRLWAWAGTSFPLVWEATKLIWKSIHYEAVAVSTFQNIFNNFKFWLPSIDFFSGPFILPNLTTRVHGH